jgi:hypothetical protein
MAGFMYSCPHCEALWGGSFLGLSDGLGSDVAHPGALNGTVKVPPAVEGRALINVSGQSNGVYSQSYCRILRFARTSRGWADWLEWC